MMWSIEHLHIGPPDKAPTRTVSLLPQERLEISISGHVHATACKMIITKVSAAATTNTELHQKELSFSLANGWLIGSDLQRSQLSQSSGWRAWRQNPTAWGSSCHADVLKVYNNDSVTQVLSPFRYCQYYPSPSAHRYHCKRPRIQTWRVALHVRPHCMR